MNSIENLHRLPKDRILVQIPLESPAYQAFLAANEERELARERTGGPDADAERKYREAVEALSAFARKLYSDSRST